MKTWTFWDFYLIIVVYIVHSSKMSKPFIDHIKRLFKGLAYMADTLPGAKRQENSN